MAGFNKSHLSLIANALKQNDETLRPAVFSSTVCHAWTAGARSCLILCPVDSIIYLSIIFILSHGEILVALQVRLKPAPVTISSPGLGYNCI